MKRTLGGLAPDDEASTAALRKIGAGEVVKVELVRPRSHRALRRWWALCNLVYTNAEQYKSADQVHQHLKILSGHATLVVSKGTGETFAIADSIAFSRLSEDEFIEVWQRAKDAIREHILPGVTDSDIEFEIARLIGDAGGIRK